MSQSWPWQPGRGSWGLNHMRAVADNGSAWESWSRGTRIFRRTGDGWRMVHQHVSYPFDPATGTARTDLVPADRH